METHGLGAMAHGERADGDGGGGLAGRMGFPRACGRWRIPELGYYGATRRLEETSTTCRLALGATLTVAAIGMIAGVVPGGVPA